jgi:hypothetical protein
MIFIAENAEESLYCKKHMSMLQPRRLGKGNIQNEIRLLAKLAKHAKDKAQTS